jgi:hypothetical protein
MCYNVTILEKRRKKKHSKAKNLGERQKRERKAQEGINEQKI